MYAPINQCRLLCYTRGSYKPIYVVYKYRVAVYGLAQWCISYTQYYYIHITVATYTSVHIHIYHYTYTFLHTHHYKPLPDSSSSSLSCVGSHSGITLFVNSIYSFNVKFLGSPSSSLLVNIMSPAHAHFHDRTLTTTNIYIYTYHTLPHYERVAVVYAY